MEDIGEGNNLCICEFCQKEYIDLDGAEKCEWLIPFRPFMPDSGFAVPDPCRGKVLEKQGRGDIGGVIGDWLYAVTS